MPTGKGQANVIIEHDDFADSPRVLELQNRFLLDTKDYDVLASNPNLAAS